MSELNHATKSLPNLLKHEYYVLIDDLDLHWCNEPNQNHFIAALFLSLRRLSRPPIKFVVSIREDIYNCLPIVDKDKSRDKLAYVEWDLASVKQIIEKRLVTFLGCRQSDIWGGILPEDGFDILARHSSSKPREIIRAVDLSIKRASLNGHKKVQTDDIEAALVIYSTERLADLGSEFNYVYPGVEAVLEKFRGRSKEFSLKEVDNLATELACEKLDGRESIPWSWAGTFDGRAEELARLLLDIGFLQLKVNRTAKPQRYEAEKMGPVNSTMWFAVHPMYAPALALLGT